MQCQDIVITLDKWATCPDARHGMRTDLLQIRVQATEKEAFTKAAELAGLGVSAWARERLRRDARKELEEAGQQVPFMPDGKAGG